VSAPGPSRIQSIDLLRGLDVLLMLFVNEIASVRGTPAFLLHVPRGADGMTITDVVFPAFLFIVGMAIPFALGARLRRAQGPGEVWRHVLTRTFALLAIGVLMVNGDEAGPGPLPPALWNVLMTVGVVLAWRAPAAGAASIPRQRALKLVGIGLLVLVALTYRATGVSGLIQLRPHWWGILGLIGWAYLVSAGVYLLAGDRPAVLTGTVGLLYCVYLADVAGEAAWLRGVPFLEVGSMLGSHAAVTLSGTVLGVMLVRHQREAGSPRLLVAQALGYAAGLAAAGLLLHTLSALHPAFVINKPLATPPWCLLSSALTVAAWAVVYLAVDVRGWRRWPPAIAMAGENPLVAYLLAPGLLSLFALSAPLFHGTNPYEALRVYTVVGFVRSIVFAWAVVRLCGLLRRGGVRMQL
jgi:predicted acyltransferase